MDIIVRRRGNAASATSSHCSFTQATRTEDGFTQDQSSNQQEEHCVSAREGHRLQRMQVPPMVLKVLDCECQNEGESDYYEES